MAHTWRGHTSMLHTWRGHFYIEHTWGVHNSIEHTWRGQTSLGHAWSMFKHYEDQGRPVADFPLVEWSCRTLLYQAQEQLHGFLRNFPNRPVAAGLRALIFPRGRTYSAPSDELGQRIVDLITYPTETRDRLCAGIYKTLEPGNPLGLLQAALEATEAATPLEEKLRNAVRAGVIKADDPIERINSANEAGILSADEAKQLRDLDKQVMDLIDVDDFTSAELRAGG